MAIRYPLSSGPLSNQPVRSYLFNTYKRTESRMPKADEFRWDTIFMMNTAMSQIEIRIQIPACKLLKKIHKGGEWKKSQLMAVHSSWWDAGDKDDKRLRISPSRYPDPRLRGWAGRGKGKRHRPRRAGTTIARCTLKEKQGIFYQYKRIALFGKRKTI